MLEVANLIAVVGGDTTAHEVRQRARCHNCGVKGNNTYQIVYTGNSDIAMDGCQNIVLENTTPNSVVPPKISLSIRKSLKSSQLTLSGSKVASRSQHED
jgi:hypothetical protein